MLKRDGREHRSGLRIRVEEPNCTPEEFSLT
jgi:hypothetical protein